MLVSERLMPDVEIPLRIFINATIKTVNKNEGAIAANGHERIHKI